MRRGQTEKERSVTVINALAETETVDSRCPRRHHPSVEKHFALTHTAPHKHEDGAKFNHNGLNYLLYKNLLLFFFSPDLVDESWSKLKCWIKPRRK